MFLFFFQIYIYIHYGAYNVNRLGIIKVDSCQLLFMSFQTLEQDAPEQQVGSACWFNSWLIRIYARQASPEGVAPESYPRLSSCTRERCPSWAPAMSMEYVNTPLKDSLAIPASKSPLSLRPRIATKDASQSINYHSEYRRLNLSY